MPTIKEEIGAMKKEFGKRLENVEILIRNELGTTKERAEEEPGFPGGKIDDDDDDDDDDGDDPRDTGRASIFGEQIKDDGCEKYAVLVGVNAYSLPVNPLRGCVNDVTQMRHVLITEFGVPAANIQVLTDANATKAAITAQLNWLVGKLKNSFGSAGMFQFSGHGTQILDQPPLDETDFLDEVIVPVDHTNLMRDDEIGAILQGVSPKRTNLCVVLDSCHSGTGIRNPVISGRSIGLDENDRDLAEFLVFISAALALQSGLQYIPSVRNGAPPIAGGHTLLAAAASDETALDTPKHGLFTEELLKNFKSGRTYQEAFDPTKLAVMQRAKRLIRNHQQTPQIENGGGSILSCFI